MIVELFRPYDMHLGSDVNPLRKRTEVLVHLLIDGDIRAPQDERIKPAVSVP